MALQAILPTKTTNTYWSAKGYEEGPRADAWWFDQTLRAYVKGTFPAYYKGGQLYLHRASDGQSVRVDGKTIHKYPGGPGDTLPRL